MPLRIHPKILLRTPYLNYFCALIVCLFVCVVDHGVNEGEPVDEQYCEQVNEDPFCDPEPEGQDLPEGYEDGKFNPIL